MELQQLPWYGQLAVFLIVGGILFGVFYMYHYSGVQEQIVSFDKEIATLDEEIKRAEQKQDKLEQLKAEKAQKEATLEQLKQILPEKTEIAQIIKNIQALVEGARLKILIWKGVTPIKRNIYVEHPYSISIEGNYHNMGIFFDQLSKLRKIFNVNKVQIKPQNTMDREFTIRSNFDIATYTYTEGSTAAPANTRSRRK
jgi:type IV pilus assembly protein PilO